MQDLVPHWVRQLPAGTRLARMELRDSEGLLQHRQDFERQDGEWTFLRSLTLVDAFSPSIGVAGLWARGPRQWLLRIALGIASVYGWLRRESGEFWKRF